jgi:hypothetical protein
MRWMEGEGYLERRDGLMTMTKDFAHCWRSRRELWLIAGGFLLTGQDGTAGERDSLSATAHDPPPRCQSTLEPTCTPVCRAQEDSNGGGPDAPDGVLDIVGRSESVHISEDNDARSVPNCLYAKTWQLT